MSTQDNTNKTEVIRISSELMDKVRSIAKENGQSYRGYITIALNSIVKKDYLRMLKKKERNAKKIHF
jgi:predicted DNA binding CopG/RHH family protein